VVVIVWLLDLQLTAQQYYHHLGCKLELRSWGGVLDITLCNQVTYEWSVVLQRTPLKPSMQPDVQFP
jgi:hypothetical protein